MAFDAGTIIAHLDLDESSFDRKLRDAEARQKRFENEPHRLRITEIFSSSDMSRARRMFTMLDQQISRDAAQRMRAGGTGSVLGALNSLFSTQQVSSAPTPQQSAQQGMLGRIIRQGGAAATPGTSGRGPSAGQVIDALAGGAGGVGGPGRNISTGGGGVSRPTGVVSGLLRGIGPGVIGIGARLAGGIGLGGSLFGALPGLLGPAAGLGIAGVGLGATNALFKATGVTTFTQAYQAAQTAQQTAVTPLQKQQAAQQMQGVIAGARQQGPGTFALFKTITSLSNAWQNFAQGMAPLLAKGLAPLATMFRQLQPALHSFFSGAITLLRPFLAGVTDIAKIALPLLGSAFRAAAPLVKPLLDGLGQLIKGVLPGVISIVKATAGPIKVFGQILGMIGRDVGGLFKAMAPAVAASMPIVKALFGVLGGLLPIIGRLAAYFARLLAPVFVQLAKTLQSLLPFLTILGRLLGQLAGAILADLAAALGAALKLLAGIAPSLTVLATALGSVFTLLENAGVFALLGSALEKIAPLLAQFVNAFVLGLAPILPPLIQLLTVLVTIIVRVLAAGLVALIPPLIKIVQALMPALVPLIVALIPLVTLLAKLIGAALVVAVKLLTPVLMIMANALATVIRWIGDVINWVVRLAVNWRKTWSDIESVFTAAWNFIWNNFAQPVMKFFMTTLPGWVRSAWSTIKSDFGSVLTWWKSLPGLILGALAGLGHQLWQFGSFVLGQFLAGLKSIATTVINWLKGFGSTIIGDVKKFFGIASPSSVFFQIGKNLMQGLFNGITGSLGGGAKGKIHAVGGTVAGWITQALKIAGAPLSWLGALEVLVSKESGGNPRAVNPTPVGSEHATGLFQTLPSTFGAYSLGGSIFDPVADAVAGIRYLRARYGSPFNIPGLLSGTYMGYDTGGWLMPVNMTSKPEAVLNPGQSDAFVALAQALASGQGGSMLSYKLDCLIAEVRKSAGKTGVAMGRVLDGVATQAAMAGWYGGG